MKRNPSGRFPFGPVSTMFSKLLTSARSSVDRRPGSSCWCSVMVKLSQTVCIRRRHPSWVHPRRKAPAGFGLSSGMMLRVRNVTKLSQVCDQSINQSIKTQCYLHQHSVVKARVWGVCAALQWSQSATTAAQTGMNCLITVLMMSPVFGTLF